MADWLGPADDWPNHPYPEAKRALGEARPALGSMETVDDVGSAWIAVALLPKMYAAPDRDTAHRRLVAFYEWGREDQGRPAGSPRAPQRRQLPARVMLHCRLPTAG